MHLSQSLDLRRRRAYVRAALKAFKKIIIDGKVFYTCNVERLKSCNRLGSEKEVALWKTHFFLSSPYFLEAEGVVFNVRPGEELASFTKQAQIDFLYLAMSLTEMLDVATGRRFIPEEPLVFSPNDSP